MSSMDRVLQSRRPSMSRSMTRVTATWTRDLLKKKLVDADDSEYTGNENDSPRPTGTPRSDKFKDPGTPSTPKLTIDLCKVSCSDLDSRRTLSPNGLATRRESLSPRQVHENQEPHQNPRSPLHRHNMSFFSIMRCQNAGPTPGGTVHDAAMGNIGNVAAVAPRSPVRIKPSCSFHSDVSTDEDSTVLPPSSSIFASGDLMLMTQPAASSELTTATSEPSPGHQLFAAANADFFPGIQSTPTEFRHRAGSIKKLCGTQRTMTGVTQQWRSDLSSTAPPASALLGTLHVAPPVETSTTASMPAHYNDTPKEARESPIPNADVDGDHEDAGTSTQPTTEGLSECIKKISNSFHYLQIVFGIKSSSLNLRNNYMEAFFIIYMICGVFELIFFSNRSKPLSVGLNLLDMALFAHVYPLCRKFATEHEWDSMIRLAWISNPQASHRVFRSSIALWVSLFLGGIITHTWYHAETISTESLQAVLQIFSSQTLPDNPFDVLEIIMHSLFAGIQVGFWSFAIMVHVISTNLFREIICEYNKELAACKETEEIDVKTLIDRQNALADMLRRISGKMESSFSLRMVYDWIFLVANFSFISREANTYANVMLLVFTIASHICILMPMSQVTTSFQDILSEANNVRACLQSDREDRERQLDSFLLYLLTCPRSYNIAGFTIDLRLVIEYAIGAYSIGTFLLRDSIALLA